LICVILLIRKFKEIIEKAGVPFTTEFEKPEEIKSGVSGCEYLVARFGSVLVSSALPGGRRIFPFPEIHIVIAHENQLVLEIEEALDGVQKKYGDNFPSQITNITGPSRTADIEKTLILGAHGPKQTHRVCIEIISLERDCFSLKIYIFAKSINTTKFY
jgi:L-lactate dehydrogenase complex protein LldG